MKPTYPALMLSLLCLAGAATAADEQPVFRDPYTLTLHLDKDHYAKYPVGKVPFVHQNAVYLFKDDNFGLNLEVDGKTLKSFSYAPDASTANVALRFTQQVKDDGSSMMLLEIINHTPYKLGMQALMVTPNQKAARPTSIIPIEPGLTNFESWPHPIVQLILHKLEIQ